MKICEKKSKSQSNQKSFCVEFFCASRFFVIFDARFRGKFSLFFADFEKIARICA